MALNPHTPLLGWSMTKTVMAGVIGLLIKDGKLSLAQTGFWPGNDGREKIRLKDLLAMSSGLRWNEAYGAVSDVTSMLYLQPDMAGFRALAALGAPAGRGLALFQRHRSHSVAHCSRCFGRRVQRNARPGDIHQSPALQPALGLPPR